MIWPWTKSRCYNGGAQHRFEPRVTYKKHPPALHVSHGIVMQNDIMALEAGTAVEQTYHGDVCVWCGKVTK